MEDAELREWYQRPHRAAGREIALVAFALQALAQQLAIAPLGLGALALAALRGLLEVAAELHFPEDALALHLLLQRAQGLIDIVVADVDLHGGGVLLSSLPA